MFNKILIANRGEIACRVIRSARQMGIATVAVFSEADREALHVELADEAVCIGPAPSKESYLVIDRIVAACRQTGAQAVHPGYGFLSENETFARRLGDEGIAFIGPPPQAIAAMGDKIASKKLAQSVGVNTIPGWNEAIESAVRAVEIARDIGYPVMIKASAGGGGKGLRVAFNDKEAGEGFSACRSEAENAFGDGRVFIEKYIVAPRHIEIQVLADAHGNCIHLNERECTIQRRHQKVLEEAPSPFLDAATRKAMGEQAVALAQAVGYQSAGTVEFVVGADKSFYFLEMNTRLQVEHPVTEFITGLDLVEQMIRVARGEPLSLAQHEVGLDGWAIECRINAEDPYRGFLPSTGRLVKYRPPGAEDARVRVDTGVFEGGAISMYYDSMVAKLIVHGRSRSEAITRMRDALNAFVISGVATNLPFQAALLQHPRFCTGDFSTAFLDEEYPAGFDASMVVHEDPGLLAAVAAFARLRYVERAVQVSGQLPGHGRRVSAEWVVVVGEQHYPVTVGEHEGGMAISCGGEVYRICSDWRFGEVLFSGTVNGRPVCMQIERLGLHFRITHYGARISAIVMTPRAAEMLARIPRKLAADRSKFVLSPMPGLLREVCVAAGQEVKAGEKLAVVEAMKMENALRAEQDGRVKSVMVEAGASVAVDDMIVEFE